ncbi:MAG: tetratricopeptide repeat protein [Planctomycetes bacterium]|nr:tetratricopeptide repeat protein [Planctomycetota bacterium]
MSQPAIYLARSDGVLPSRRLPLWATFVVFVVLAAVVYLPTVLRAQFLGFDDNFFFGPDNPEFREGVLAVLDPRRTIANAYLPVAHLSLWLDWKLSGGPLLPHLHSLLLHVLAAVAMVAWLSAMRIGTWIAHGAGALFLLHPALAESVAWVSSRKDVLSGLFVFLALLQTVRLGERPSGGRLVAIAALGVLAMYSKATAMVLPLLALLVCLWTGDKRRQWLAPVVLAAVTGPILWHHVQFAAAQGTLVSGSPVDRLPQVPGALAHYLMQAFWPARLNVLYPEVQTLQRFAEALPTASILVGVVLLLVWFASTRPTLRPVALGLSVFGIALLPFNTAWPASSVAAADRYLYLALPGAALATMALLAAVLSRAGVVLGAAAVLVLGNQTMQRARAFGDDEALWTRSLAIDRDNAVAHFNLAVHLLNRPEVDLPRVREHLTAAASAARYPIHELRARRLLVDLSLQDEHFQEAMLHADAAIAVADRIVAAEAAGPRRDGARVLLLEALLRGLRTHQRAGDHAGVDALLARAREVAPAHPSVIAAEAMLQFAPIAQELAARAAAGDAVVLPADDPRVRQAVALLEPALARAELHSELNLAMGQWLAVSGGRTQAIKHFRRALRSDPNNVEAWLGLAQVCHHAGLYAEAEQYAREGLANAHDPRLQLQLGLALAHQQRLDDAIFHLESYLRLRPKDRNAARILSNFVATKAVARMHDPGTTHGELQALLDQALAVNPDEPRVHIVRGKMARDLGKPQEAVAHFDAVLALMPQLDDVQQMRADALGHLGFVAMLEQPPDEQLAGDSWLRFLQVAPPDMPRDTARRQLAALWQLAERRGVEQLQNGDAVAAAGSFRRCLQLDPEQHWASWLLALALWKHPDPDLTELESLCERAVAWQRRNGDDPTRQVTLQVLVLQRAGKPELARTAAEALLAAPPTTADATALAQLRSLVGK